jgi:fermentation-respiration switch protein FrsA (DUF1100 family)
MGSILNKIVNKFTFFPHNKVMMANKDMPHYVSEKWIKTTDGESLQSFYFKHSDTKSHSLIIYFHGNTGNLFSHHRFEHAEKLYDMGCNVLLISYRGYSKSSGKPSEKGINIDGESALDYANKTLGYSNEDIFIFGRSLGSTVAVEISQSRDFKGVVLLTPLTSAKDMGKEMDFSYFSFLAKNSFNSIKKIKNLKSPLLIIHGTEDKQIPFSMGEKLFTKYKGDKNLIAIEGAGHNNIQQVDPNSFWNGIESFLNS